MIDALSRNTYAAELAIVLSVFCLIAVGFFASWVRKQINYILIHVYRIQDDTEQAMKTIATLMEKVEQCGKN